VAAQKSENRARGRASARPAPGSLPGSLPWPEPWSLPWPRGAQGPQGARWGAAWFAAPARIREWAAQEVAAGRLLPWFAVAYGAGIVLYFTAEREPALWAAAALASISVLAAVLLRRHVGWHFGRPCAMVSNHSLSLAPSAFLTCQQPPSAHRSGQELSLR
jgi:hypothetical protein